MLVTTLETVNLSAVVRWAPTRSSCSSIAASVFWHRQPLQQCTVLRCSLSQHSVTAVTPAWLPCSIRLRPYRVVVPGRVSIWESNTGRCLHSLEGPGESVEWVSWHPRGDVILAGSEDFTAWMWNAQSGDMMQVSQTCIRLVYLAGTGLCSCLPPKSGLSLANAAYCQLPFAKCPENNPVALALEGCEVPWPKCHHKQSPGLVLNMTLPCCAHATRVKTLWNATEQIVGNSCAASNSTSIQKPCWPSRSTHLVKKCCWVNSGVACAHTPKFTLEACVVYYIECAYTRLNTNAASKTQLKVNSVIHFVAQADH